MRRRRSTWPRRSTACCKCAGKPRLLERVAQVRDAAAAALGEAWNHARFEAERTRIEQQLAGGRLREALAGAQQLLQRARAAGEQAYPGADYDLAVACFLLARVLKTAGGSEQALPLLDEARQRFEAIAKERASKAAERMASVCFTEQGDCLLDLGRLDEAAAAYEEAIRRDEQRGDDRRCRRRQRPAWDRPPAAAPLPGGAGGLCRSARAVHPVGRAGHRRRDLASDRHGVSAGGTAGSGGGCLPEIARDQGAARKCRRAGEHAQSTGVV